MADRAVAAHCHGKRGILAALRAGVRTIEHGTYLDDECCDAMLETGAILVPTCSVLESNQDLSVPEWARRKGAALAAQHAEAVALVNESGVPIASGTDIAMCKSVGGLSWGAHSREPGLLVKSGMSSLQAIEAATATVLLPSARRRPSAVSWPPTTTPTSSPLTLTPWPTSLCSLTRPTSLTYGRGGRC